MSEHHKTLSPSKFPALLKCACYEAGEVGEAAERGTAQHAVLAASLSGKLFPSMLTIEEEEAVVWAEAQIGALIPGLKLIEEKLVILDDDCTELTFGTADAMSENGRVLIDYKSGLVRNYKPQMAVYAFGAIQRFGIDSVHVVELYGRTKEVIEYDMTEWDCRAIVREVVARVRDENKQPTPCDYCAWCANNKTCVPIADTALAVVRGYEVPAFETWHSSDVTDPVVMGKMLDAAKIVSGWVESVEAHARTMALAGTIPQGYKLQEQSGKRAVSDLQGLFSASGLTAEEFLPCCSATLTKIRAALGKGKKQFDEFITPFTTSGKPTVSLVKEKE